jgi:hypothetical protein
MESTLVTDHPGSYILRIVGAPSTTRVPVHYALLIDNSGSMGEDGKLENVKRCIRAMLDILNENDMLSIVTFESASEIILPPTYNTSANKAHIAAVIEKIRPENMTNLSAGLGNVRAVLSTAASIQTHIKTGVLILTDGHVNQGVIDADQLKAITRNIQDTCAGLTIQCIGYGNDHNSALLKDISIETQGSYNIVNTIEDVATAFGDSLGGLMSCVAQNVVVELPVGSVVLGPVPGAAGADNVLKVGDIYADTEKMILYTMPALTLVATPPHTVQVRGMILPLLTPIVQTVAPTQLTERVIDIELTRHRYTCAALLREIAIGPSMAICDHIQEFKTALADTAYDGNPIAAQLRNEVRVLEEGLTAQADTTVINQHISYFGLGRGFSTPSRSQGARQHATYSPVYTQAIDEDIDVDPDYEDQDPQNHRSVTTSVFQNPTQRMLSNNLRSASQHP